jgi:hypothetical protein
VHLGGAIVVPLGRAIMVVDGLSWLAMFTDTTGENEWEIEQRSES